MSRLNIRPPDARTYPCPCCGYLTFTEPPGSFDICTVCHWEDDIVQLSDPEELGGANGKNLMEAQRDYVERCALRDVAFPPGSVQWPEKPRDQGWRLFEVSDYACAMQGPSHGFRHETRHIVDPLTLYYWRPSYWRKNPH